MRMKTTEEIKKGLECCKPRWLGDHWKTCDAECPYATEGSFCRNVLNTDALAYIRQLEAEWYRLVTEVQKLREERDRYWEYIKGLGCDTCGGDCDRCEVTLDRVWTGWVWDGEKETKHG